ncbi:hypothetical protein JOF53_005540 [Crossiella equi]|uniref:PQQ enzyme repeat n=1 Tax=Crossiella equi TaxID=130796 RepID=A0ABS5AJB6_9PSEU|nr:PA2928 family protein [Crossiella equi]MBP2476668.1 hypothetical protein [Crossiella equi]
MKDISQSGYVWAEPGPYEIRPRSRRPVRLVPVRLFVVLLPVLLFSGLFFGGSYLVSPEARVTVQPGIGLATVDQRPVALIPYQRSGSRGMFQLLTQDMFQARLAAVDLGTGEVRWDTQLSDGLVWQAEFLAAGARLAYFATDGGLVVLDLADGRVVAGDGEVPGLPQVVASRAAYGYDAAHRAVVALAEGGLRTLALDSDTATPAPPEVEAAWAGRLTAKPAPPRSESARAGDQAGIGGGESVLLRERAQPALELLRRFPDGRTAPVLTLPSHEAEILLAGEKTAAGAGAGLVVLKHARGVTSRAAALSVVSLRGKQVTASVPIGTGPARAIELPTRHVLVLARAEDDHSEGVALVGPDGRLTWLAVGQQDFFGNPR